jgi:hypothetical protein
VDEGGGAAPRHEDARPQPYAHAVELGPAEHLLERLAGDPSGDHVVEWTARLVLGEQQPRLVVGEHAPGVAQMGRDGVGVRPRGAHPR